MSPLIVLAVLGGVVLIGVAMFAGLYNGLVRVRNACNESWSDIDTELKRRYDLITNLIESVKAYAAPEKGVFDSVLQARNAAQANHGSPNSQAADETALNSSLRQLFALAEAYPDLKANQNFIKFQEELANTEDRLQRARRFYNANVRDLNNRLETFPSNVVAQMFAFGRREYFEPGGDAAYREVPAVKFS